MKLQRLRRLLRGRPNRPQAADPAQRHMILASETDQRIVQAVRGLTMTNPLRIHALLDAVDYAIARDLPGAFVECGVWRGGLCGVVRCGVVWCGVVCAVVWCGVVWCD